VDDVFPKLGGADNFNAIGGQQKSHKGRWVAGALIVILAVAGLTVWSAIDQYNGLQRNDVRVDFSWNEVLNQYTRRANLIPNLVSVVKSYASHESELFTQIAATRTGLSALSASAQDSRDPQILEQFQKAQNQLSAQLSRLLVVAEKYPDLKSSALFQDLMAQLEGTENRIAYARQRYIGAIADYNFGIRRFPANLLAAQAGFKQRAATAVANETVVLQTLKIDLK